MLKRILAICLCLSCSFAMAGPHADELKKCFTQATSSKDNLTLIKWMAKAMVAHPGLTNFPAIENNEKSLIDKEFAVFVEKMLITDCRKQTLDTFQNEGMPALEGALETLSQLILKELMAQKEVSQEIGAFTRYLDQNKLMAALLSPW